jgi:hypothetical protein
MSVGFGFSDANFISAVQLVSAIVDAVRRSGTAFERYHDLFNELSSLKASLIQVGQIEVEISQAAERIALYQVAAQCQRTIEDFEIRILKYKARHESSLGKVKDSWTKTALISCRDEDLTSFRAAVLGHEVAITILLSALQMQRSSQKALRQDRRLRTLAGNIQDLSFRRMNKLHSRATSIKPFIQTDNELWGVTHQVLRSNLLLFLMSLNFQKFITQIPGQILRHHIAFSLNAPGFLTPPRLQHIESAAVSYIL